jgi:hypothetical protein
MVNRSGWNSGNAMAFILTSAANSDVFRKVRSANAAGSEGPKLHIEYAANILDVRVSSASDDMNQYWSSSSPAYPGTVQDTSYLSIGRSNSANTNYTGLRFTNVVIPQGATINSAYLKFKAQATSVDSSTNENLKIFGEKRSTTPTFSSVASSIDSVGYRATH